VQCAPPTMLLVGRAPAACRAPRLGGASAGRDGGAAAAAPALARGLQLRQGLRAALRPLSVAALPPALRARRGRTSGTLFRLCSSGARAAEVRPARLLCLHTCTSLWLLCQQASAPITVWVKRTDVTGARYAAVKGVDPQQTVDDFIARWMAQAKLDIDPALVTLRLVPCEARKPTPEEEQEAAELDPLDTLIAAGVADGFFVLAVVAGACGAVRSALPPGGAVLTQRPRGHQCSSRKRARCRRRRRRRQ